MARERRGRWFDPRVVDAFEDMLGDAEFWRSLDAEPGELERLVAAHEPPDLVRMASDAEIDGIVGAFAGIVDAKSPFTYHHSERVADISQQLGDALGLQAGQLAALRRVALLHDLGKLALPNRILDRPGPLNNRERALMQEHPAHSERILERVPVLSGLAATAGAHHERLDGSGYPKGLTADELALPARILAVADVYEALTSERPYRGAMSAGDALAVVRAEVVAGRLSPEVAGILETAAG
jgi:HD-GYP domain-containing protein (c-di-GMP phosphodiesterase class II)